MFWHEIWTERSSEGHSNPSITLKPNSPPCYSHSGPLCWNQTVILIIAKQTRLSESWGPLEWFCARVNECSQWSSILSLPALPQRAKPEIFTPSYGKTLPGCHPPPAKKQLICQSFEMSWWSSPRTARITSQHLQSTSFLSPLPHGLFSMFSASVCLFWSLSVLIRDICIPREMCTWFTYLLNPGI